MSISHTYESTKREFEKATDATKEMANNPEVTRSRGFVSQMTFNTSLLMICLYLLQEVEDLKVNKKSEWLKR